VCKITSVSFLNFFLKKFYKKETNLYYTPSYEPDIPFYTTTSFPDVFTGLNEKGLIVENQEETSSIQKVSCLSRLSASSGMSDWIKDNFLNSNFKQNLFVHKDWISMEQEEIVNLFETLQDIRQLYS
jgi:hypothetical protein